MGYALLIALVVIYCVGVLALFVWHFIDDTDELKRKWNE